MNIEIQDELHLDDDKVYLVVSKATHDDEEYFLITEIDNKNNTMILKLEDNKLIYVKDNSLLLELSQKFFHNTLENMKEN